MPPGRRRSAAHGHVRRRHGGRIELRGLVLQRDDDVVPVELGGQVDPARLAAIAVADRVRRGLVDRLDEIVDAVRRGLAAAGHLANDRAELGQSLELGRNASVPASGDHPRYRSLAADQACSSTRLPSGSVA